MQIVKMPGERASSFLCLLIVISLVPFTTWWIPACMDSAFVSLCFSEQDLEDCNHHIAVIEWTPEELILYCIVEVNNFTASFLCWNLKSHYFGMGIILGHTRFVKPIVFLSETLHLFPYS